MTRPLRLEFSGAIYHVTSRGNARHKIYMDDEDREQFLVTLAWVVQRFGWLCHAYCLMDNHYHLMIETPEPNLSRGMRQLNGVYTQGFNRRHRKVGHLFQGRFKAILVERNSYLLELCRYVVLNPVRAKMVKSPQSYAWSSYRPTMGLDSIPPGLSTIWVLGQFAKTQAVARRRYADFVQSGVSQASPWGELKGQILLGGETFVEKLAPALDAIVDLQEIPKRQRQLHRPTLRSVLVTSGSRRARNQSMAKAYLKHGFTLAQIGQAAGLHYATVSRIIQKLEKMS